MSKRASNKHGTCRNTLVNGTKHVYAVVHDPCHGPTANRYTVYRLSANTPRGGTYNKMRVVGRELPLSYCLKYIKRLEKGIFPWRKR
jgi:hypothetical protein